MNKPIGAIDGDKLLESLRKEAEFCVKEKFNERNTRFYLGRETALTDIIGQLESGKFNLSDRMGEATRLREALQRVRIHLIAGMSEFSAEEARYIVDEALSSSHREDGIQQLREMYNLYQGTSLEDAHSDYRRGVEDTLKFLGIAIPGITEAR